MKISLKKIYWHGIFLTNSRLLIER